MNPHLSQPSSTIQSLLVASLISTATFCHSATFTVTSTDDSGPGTLRQAMIDANLLADFDLIDFNIPGDGPHFISPLTALPTATNPVTIDGYTQPGASPNTLANGNDAVLKIRISGLLAGGGTTGFRFNSTGCSLRGFSIVNFDGDAVFLSGQSDTVVQGNFIGLYLDGITAQGNNGKGIRSTSGSSLIGGPLPADRNVISANASGGIELFNSANNQIQGNFIGTDASGTIARGNASYAISISNPNSSGNLIGGTNSGARNLIAASTGVMAHGIVLDNCNNNRIEGNYIGTDVTGTNPLPNSGSGVQITTALNNSIGGLNPGAGNVIAFNNNAGVRLPSGTNSALANSIFSNTGPGIDLETAGVTPNDTGDGDGGANNQQNFPVLTSAILSAGSLQITGSLNSKPSGNYRIEFFSNLECDPITGHGQGQLFLGSTDLTTDASGNASFDLTLPALDTHHQTLTATATDTDINATSEFSLCQPIAILSIPPAWNNSYNGPLGSGELLNSITTDDAWNSYVTGISVGQGTGNDCLTIKYAPDGTQLWTARYNGPVNGSDVGKQIATDSSGNVYVIGESRGTNANPDFITIKYDKNGNQLWTARYNSPANGNDVGLKIVVSNTGTVVVGGESGEDAALIKYDNNGNQLWATRFTGPNGGSVRLRGLAVDNEGSPVITGGTFSPAQGQNFTTAKFDADGNLLWTKHYSGPGSQTDLATAITIDQTSNILITGLSPGNGTQQDFATVKYDPAGNQLWDQRLDGPASGRDEPVAVAVDAANNVYVAGTLADPLNGPQFGIAKYNPEGAIQWIQLFGGPENNATAGLDLDLSGNVYVTGTSGTGTNAAITTAKFNGNGDVVWLVTEDTPNIEDLATGIALNKSGAVLVAGTSNADYLTVNYPQPGYPEIHEFPTSKIGFLGEYTGFGVGLTNTSTANFQWLFNNSELPGKTSSSITLSNLQYNHAGAYSVLVSNLAGIIKSPPATLTILTPQAPQLTEQPQSQTLNPGDPLLLTADGISSGITLFQWRLNGVNIPNATNTSFSIPSVTTANSGSYTIAAQNELGSVISSNAIITVTAPPLTLADIFAYAPLLTTPTDSGRGTNTTATVEPGEPLHNGKSGGHSLWLSWQAPDSGIASFNTLGSDFDTVLAVYSGLNVSNLTEVASDDDKGGFLNSSLSFNATSGAIYHVAIDGFAGATGAVVLNWNLQPTTNSLPVILSQPVDQTVPLGNSVVYAVQPDPAESGWTYQWFFNDTAIPGATTNQWTVSSASNAKVGGYFVRITKSGLSLDSRTADLQINNTGAEVQTVRASDKFQDLFDSGNFLLLGNSGGGGGGQGFVRAAALNRGFSGTQVFSSFGSRKEPGEPNHCNVVGGASSWFAYSSTDTGMLSINTDGSTFDTVLAVYTGESLENLMPEACDNNSGLDGEDSALAFPVSADTIYFIVVDGVNGATGAVQLNYALMAPATLTAIPGSPGADNQLQLDGQPNGTFEIQFSTSLPTWMTLLTTNTPTGSVTHTHAGSGSLPSVFYRALTLP